VSEASRDPRSDLALPVLVVTGTAREARIAASPAIITIQAGADPGRLRAVLEASVQERCRAVVSFGIAGGLDPLLKPCDVVVAEGIVSDGARWPAQPVLAQRLASTLERGGMKVILADVAGVDAPLFDPAAKKCLRTETGAAAVDMESHIAAAHAAERRLPFAAIRVICDPARRALPPWTAAALLPSGEVNVAAVLRALLRQPGHLPATVRLAIDAAAAFRALDRCRVLLGVGLGFPDLAQPLSDLT
jgi:adenosylhomocysteine nucleosidase